MSEIQVLSRTQRIIVDPLTSAIRVVYAGPVGPGGLPGTAAGGHGAEGIIPSPLLVWTMPHDLGFKPSGWLFWDENDNLIEPEDVSDITTAVALATFIRPVAGRWAAS